MRTIPAARCGCWRECWRGNRSRPHWLGMLCWGGGRSGGEMGAEIHSRDGDVAPLEIRGGNLRAIDYALPVPSAQVKSAILLAGLYAEGPTAVREPVRTRDHTERALREFGATVETVKDSIRIQPRPKLVARQLTVPGDLSGGVFLACA